MPPRAGADACSDALTRTRHGDDDLQPQLPQDSGALAHADQDPAAARRADLAFLRMRGAVQNNPLLLRAASNNSLVAPHKQSRPVSVISACSVASSASVSSSSISVGAGQACPPPASAAISTLPTSPLLPLVSDSQVPSSPKLQLESPTRNFRPEFPPPPVGDIQKLSLGHQRHPQFSHQICNLGQVGAETPSIDACAVQLNGGPDEVGLTGANNNNLDSFAKNCFSKTASTGLRLFGDGNGVGNNFERNRAIPVEIEHSGSISRSPTRISPFSSLLEPSCGGFLSSDASKSQSKFASLFDDSNTGARHDTIAESGDSRRLGGLKDENFENFEMCDLMQDIRRLSDDKFGDFLFKDNLPPIERLVAPPKLQNLAVESSHSHEEKDKTGEFLGSQSDSELLMQILGAFDHDWFNTSSAPEKPNRSESALINPETLSIPAPDLELDPSMQNYVAKCVNLFSRTPEVSETNAPTPLVNDQASECNKTEALGSATAPNSVTWALKRLAENEAFGKLIGSSSESTLLEETDEITNRTPLGLQSEHSNNLNIATVDNFHASTSGPEFATLQDDASFENLSDILPNDDALGSADSSASDMIVGVSASFDDGDEQGSIFSRNNSVGIWGIPKRSTPSGRKSVNWGLARFGQLQQTKLFNPDSPVVKTNEVDLSKKNGVLFFQLDDIDEIVVPDNQKITINITLTYNQNATLTIPQMTYDPAKNSMIIVDYDCMFKLPSNLSEISPRVDAIVRIAPVVETSSTSVGTSGDFHDISMSRNTSRLKPQISHSKSMILPSIFRGPMKGSSAGTVGTGLGKMQAVDAQKRLPLRGICTRSVLIENVRELAEDADGVVCEHVWNAQVSSGNTGLSVKMRLNMRVIGAVKGAAACDEAFIPETFEGALSGIELKALHDSVEVKGYMSQIGGGLKEWKRCYFELKGCTLSAYSDSSLQILLMELDVSLVQTIRSSCVSATISPKSERGCATSDFSEKDMLGRTCAMQGDHSRSTSVAIEDISGIVGGLGGETSLSFGSNGTLASTRRSRQRTRTATSKMNDSGTPSLANVFEIELKDGEIIQFSTCDESVAGVTCTDPTVVEKWWRVFEDDYADDGDDDDIDDRVEEDEGGITEEEKKPERGILDEMADFEDMHISESRGGRNTTAAKCFLLDSSTQATKHWLYGFAFAATAIGDDHVPEWLRFT
ncbi:hypothetical protein HDU83_003591 [Entophlyctis luteolus]|nr:hypothetical protein HDU83_003591 [Entophlyctis luteolus]